MWPGHSCQSGPGPLEEGPLEFAWVLLGPGWGGGCWALCRGSLGWPELPSPSWYCSAVEDQAAWQVPAAWGQASCPTGSDRLGDFAVYQLASPLPHPSAHSQHGDVTESVAASGRNCSDRGHGAGGAGLGHGAWSSVPRAAPQLPSTAAPSLGAELGREGGCHRQGPVPNGSASLSHPWQSQPWPLSASLG